LRNYALLLFELVTGQKPFQLNGSGDFVRNEDFVRIAAWGGGTEGCKVLLEDVGVSFPLFCVLR